MFLVDFFWGGRIQFSILAFALLSIGPSFLAAYLFYLVGVPIKISLSDPKSPLQLLFLGVILPAPAYLVSYAIFKLPYPGANPFLPILVAIGIIGQPSGQTFISEFRMWFTFFVIYYSLCALLFTFLALAFRYLENADFLETFGLLDDERFATLLANDVRIYVDIVTVDGNFVYAGMLRNTTSKIYFKGGAVILSDVLKIPVDEADKPIEMYALERAAAGQLDARSYLGEMCFPKASIANINIRVGGNVSTEKTKFV